MFMKIDMIKRWKIRLNFFFVKYLVVKYNFINI